MHIPKSKFVNRSFFKTNFLYGLVGIGIGLFICALECAIKNKLIPLNDIISTLLFSMVITLSITNPIYIFLRYFRTEKTQRWKFILVYYGCSLVGMLFGIELSYWAISFVFHVPYVFLSHYSDYRFSLLIVLVINTIVYFYRAQQATLNERLRKKELDLVKVKQLITQAELQTLQSKINPHFLYNSLNSIASLIHEDADKAEDMTLKLSRLFRYSINSQQENMASITEEMEIVITYLAIEKVRFGDRLNFVIDVDKDVKNMHIPRFLIQPLVENALKHGLNDKASNGELKINIKRNENTITISIADNGKPFPAELNMGYGLQSTYDKLALIYGENYQVQIINSPEKQVRILIPATA